MKKQNKGFTIVELVIVIAVIAVLAAVLIPTFSSLIRKANLKADQAAVRDMNMALAADEKLYGAPDDIEGCMQVLANAGYNSENWVALTSGYEVYWYKEANRMILYNAREAKVEYPTEYTETWKEGSREVNLFTATKDKRGNSITLQVYNNNVKKAIELDTGFNASSATGGKSITEMSSGSTASSASEQAALSSIGEALGNNTATSNDSLKESLGLSSSDTVYVNASKELDSKTASTDTTYAAMQILSVSDQAIDYASQSGGGEAASSNLYYISITEDSSASLEQVSAAQKAASEYVYSLFTQINEGKIDNGAAIVLQSGVTIDASSHEWAPIKRFEGYFGTGDKDNPITISGAKLTSNTSYSATITFDGSSGKYFVTGFIGTVYGNTTIENVVFKSMNIDQPASDFNMAETTKTVSRNSVGVIGGIIDGYVDDKGNFVSVPANVVLRNIVVASDVKIVGCATAAGLVAYVGGSADKQNLINGMLLIDNCKVHAEVCGLLDSVCDAGYGPCGGLLGFSCRANEDNSASAKALQKDTDSVTGEVFNIVIKDSLFDGKVDGYRDIGAAVGNVITGNIVFVGSNDFSGATLNAKGMAGKFATASAPATVGAVAGNVQGNIVFAGTVTSLYDADNTIPVYSKARTASDMVYGYTSYVKNAGAFALDVDGLDANNTYSTNNGVAE